MSQLRLLWQTLICFLVLLCCERLPGLAEEPLISLLELRQEKTAELSWTFARDMSSGTPIDWVNMPANQDPFQEIHRQGLGSFKQIEGQQASGIAVVAASGSPYKYVFELTGKKYAVFSDGTTYSTLLPTTELSGATSSSSLETSDQESSFTVLAKYYSGFHYAPFRISQLGGCFGTQEESIALLDFIGLLRNPAIEKSFSTNNGKYSVRFPSFTEGMRSGHVDYTFDDSGALEQVSWIAGKGWSPSHTIEIRNEPGLNGLPWPREVHQVDWNSARALNYAFGDWAVPEQSSMSSIRRRMPSRLPSLLPQQAMTGRELLPANNANRSSSACNRILQPRRLQAIVTYRSPSS